MIKKERERGLNETVSKMVGEQILQPAFVLPVSILDDALAAVVLWTGGRVMSA